MTDYLRMMEEEDSAAPQEGNRYLGMMEDFEAGHQAQFAASTGLAASTSPEEEARKKRIANLLGTPVAAVEGDPDTAKRLALQKTIANNTADTPALQEKYTDADFAKLAHDQSAELGMIERTARHFAAGFAGTGVGSTIKGLGETLHSLEQLTGSKSLLADTLIDIGKTTKDYWRGLAPEGDDSKYGQVIQGVGQIIPQLLGGYFLKGVSALQMFAQGADQMADKIERDKVSQNADKDRQAWEVLSGGAITGATEYLVTKLILSPPQTLALKNMLLDRAAKIGLGTVSEGVQELLENIGHDIAHIAITSPDSKVAFGEALEAGEVGAMVGTIASSVVQAALHIRTRGMQQTLTELSDASKLQQLRERDPETYQGFADNLAAHLASTTDGAVENLYVDANTFHQVMIAAQLDPVEVANAVPSLAGKLDEAIATGGDIVLPLNEFIGKVAGTEIGDMLNPHLRSTPEAPSMAEVEAAAKLSTDLQARADAILAKQGRTDDVIRSANEVQKTIFDQLNATGTYAAPVSRAYASFVRDFYVTTAAEMGVTPMELYQAHPYKITSGELGGGQMTQGQTAIESPEFKSWFGESKVVDATGKPLVVNHATNVKFNAFDRKYTTGQLGFHFGSEDVAKNLYGNEKAGYVLPVYLSIQNPLRLDDLGGWQGRDVVRMVNERIGANLPESASDRRIRAAIEKAGYDGIVYRNEFETSPNQEATDSYIAFSPTQIKSATANRGTYDPNDPNIMHQSLSSRLPSAIKATEDPLMETLTIDFDVTLSDLTTLGKNMEALMATPNMRKLKGKGAKDPKRQAEEFIDHAVNNLLWLHDHMPAEMRERAERWYDGGRKTIETWADRYGISEMQGAAVIAVLSPQNGWFPNVSQAERIADIVFGMRDYTWDEAMTETAIQLSGGSLDKRMQSVVGKTLDEVIGLPDLAARWIRVYDQTYNSRSYRVLTPEGGVADYVKTTKGEEATMAWKSYSTIAKAVSILTDGRAENVHYQLGKEHKVRNFYNNLFDPNSAGGYTTIDTHAVAAALLRPLSANDIEVLQAFGGTGSSKSSVTGLNGTYPLYLEAYRRAAEQRGVLPRQMQSITWEAVRGLFDAGRKIFIKKDANQIWERYKKGEIEQDQAQKEILALARDITPPDWVAVPFNDTVSRTYEGPAQKRIDDMGETGRQESAAARVFFEVAPDPNNAKLTAEWGALDSDTQAEISRIVAPQVVSNVLKELGTGGSTSLQLGGYLGATNPSLTLSIDRWELAVTAAKLMGYALSQDSMMVVSEQPGLGLEPTGALTIDLPEGYGGEQIRALYDRLWELEKDGKKLIGGHTTVDGRMIILNYSGLDTESLAMLVNDHLGGEFTIRGNTVYAAFPSKEEYNYAGDNESASSRRSSAKTRADHLRAETTKLLRSELDKHRANAGTLYQAGLDRGGIQGGRGSAGQPDQAKSPADSVRVTGIHFSKSPREVLSSAFQGTNAAGQELQRLPADKNSPLYHRIYFYINTGKGIRPEPGVGTHAHRYDLDGLYDKSTGTLDVRVPSGENVNNAFELALLDAGYTGWLDRDSGVACLLGEREISPEYLGADTGAYANAPQVGPLSQSPAQQLSQELRDNKTLPQGELTGPRWADRLEKIYPEIYAQLDAAGYIEPLRAYEQPIPRYAIPFIGEMANTLYQSAWHGSPYTFSKFSTDHIGTGEGAQAYGYGLYFAGAKDVAEFYRKTLALDKGVTAKILKDGPNDYSVWALKPGADQISLVGEHLLHGQAVRLKEEYDRKSAGRLYKVELAPAEDEYLLWDNSLSEQSEKVKAILEKANPELSHGRYSDYANESGVGDVPNGGKALYEMIAQRLGERRESRRGYNVSDDKAASEYLLSLGIRGIKYADGASRGKDGKISYNYVIFSEDDVAIQEMYQASQASNRGGFNPATLTTILTQESDYSTFLHETAHFFLTTYAELAAEPNASPRLKADMQTLLDWFGVADLDAWNALPFEVQRKHHEAFAYNYEVYLFEGRAPNPKMQTVFERFSAWLKRVYTSIATELNQIYRQQHGEDLPILTGEVRQVMDRMLASDKQIDQAEQIRGMSPIFRDQAESGMTDEEWAAYQELQDDAHSAALASHRASSLRQMKWLSNAKSKTLRALQATTRDIRKGILAEVTEEVNNMPIYRAKDALKNATDIEELAIADAMGYMGYGSMAELEAAIKAAPKKKDLIRQKTDQRMLEEHGELMDPKAVEKAVDEAVHNQARARFIGVELRHLSKSTRPVRVMQEAARQAARSILGKKRLKDIRPHEFTAAEARAAKAADEAMKKGDTATATQAKEHQLLQNQLAAEAINARAQVAKSMDAFKRIFGSDKALGKSRDMNYVNVARAILAHYGLGSSEQPASFYLAKLKAYDPEFYAEIEDMITAHQAPAKPINELTLDEFADLSDQIQALWHLSKRSKQIEIDGQLMDRKAVVGELNAEIRELNAGPALAGYKKAVTTWEKAKISLMGIRAALRRVEAWVDAMDRGNPNGPFRKYIWNPISEAVTAYRVAKKDHMTEFLQLLQDNQHLFRMGPIDATEIGYTFNRGRNNTSELLHALLHTGNASNKRKLLLGREWATLKDDGKTLNTSQWDSFIARAIREGLITKEHYDFCQKVWDLLERMKPSAQKAHREMYGFYFDEVTATPFATPFGVYAGGYVPAVTDPSMVTDASMRNEQETSLVDNSFMFPSTGRGFTKARVDYNKPLLLNIGYLASHMDKVLRFTYIEPRIKDVARIVKTNRSFASTMDALDPTTRGDMLVPWLQRTAMQMISIPSKGQVGRAVDAICSYLRVNTGMQIMVGNITNTLQQFTGISIAALKVRPKYLRNALWQYVRRPKETTSMIAEKSDFMDTRINSYQFEMQRTMDEILLDPNKYDKLRDFASQHGYFLQQGTQGIVDTLTWIGAYNQAVEQGATERDAVRQADAAVRMTQSSFAAEDASRIEVNSAFVRMFTHFYNYFNMMANITGSEFATTLRTLGLRKGAGRMVYVYAAGFMIPAVLSELIVQAIGGFDDGDDDEYDLGDAMQLFFGSQARALAAMAPGLGQVATAAAGRFTSAYYDDRISTSPAVSILESMVSAPFSLYKAIAEEGSYKKAAKDMLTLLGMITRLPLGQIGKPVGYMLDVHQGKAEPESGMDVVRGLVSGKDVNRQQ